MKSEMIPVLVTTKHKGVFFGYVENETDLDFNETKLFDARAGIYYSADMKGTFGLASKGPSNGCRIGPAAPWILLNDITAFAACTEEAASRWESAPWAI